MWYKKSSSNMSVSSKLLIRHYELMPYTQHAFNSFDHTKKQGKKAVQHWPKMISDLTYSGAYDKWAASHRTVVIMCNINRVTGATIVCTWNELEFYYGLLKKFESKSTLRDRIRCIVWQYCHTNLSETKRSNVLNSSC